MLTIERAAAEDVLAVRSLLARVGLPLDGVTGDLPMVVARHDGRVVGVAAFEPYADGALLRSVAVDPQFHGEGIGHAVTTAVLRIADDARFHDVFLLTTTAERFFPRFGFEVVSRADVPASVSAAVEFVSACPASAIVMRRRVRVDL